MTERNECVSTCPCSQCDLTRRSVQRRKWVRERREEVARLVREAQLKFGLPGHVQPHVYIRESSNEWPSLMLEIGTPEFDVHTSCNDLMRDLTIDPDTLRVSGSVRINLTLEQAFQLAMFMAPHRTTAQIEHGQRAYEAGVRAGEYPDVDVIHRLAKLSDE